RINQAPLSSAPPTPPFPLPLSLATVPLSSSSHKSSPPHVAVLELNNSLSALSLQDSSSDPPASPSKSPTIVPPAPRQSVPAPPTSPVRVQFRPALPPMSRTPGIRTPSGLPPMARVGGKPPGITPPARANRPRMDLGSLGAVVTQTAFSNFSRFVDPSGKLNFAGKAVLHADGVDFSNGNSFKIKMNELELKEELGKGQYGTVQKVFHKPTNVTMAMKEIRLELDQTKLNQIIMELDILHRSASPYIVEFYGAFFIESCVYYCMEYMDCGSLDKLCDGAGAPEPVLAKICLSMVRGLKFLKDDMSIIHRDVKPTNVLVNLKGDVKLCDFGVSGQLEKSMAKTNIGCQSYMAPERIRAADTYTVSSDVWSLGLSLVEMAGGKYPYAYDNMFAQLKAIVDDEPPNLPNSFSTEARDFIDQCLHKNPLERPTYLDLLMHPFLQKYQDEEVDMARWAEGAFAAMCARREGEGERTQGMKVTGAR
ncbi:kinase-like protein, partial [Jimgerdemannia flammicorona]